MTEDEEKGDNQKCWRTVLWPINYRKLVTGFVELIFSIEATETEVQHDIIYKANQYLLLYPNTTSPFVPQHRWGSELVTFNRNWVIRTPRLAFGSWLSPSSYPSCSLTGWTLLLRPCWVLCLWKERKSHRSYWFGCILYWYYPTFLGQLIPPFLVFPEQRWLTGQKCRIRSCPMANYIHSFIRSFTHSLIPVLNNNYMSSLQYRLGHANTGPWVLP